MIKDSIRTDTGVNNFTEPKLMFTLIVCRFDFYDN